MRIRTLQNQRGLTLFETLIAAIMTGILMTAALPSLSSSLTAHALQASVRSTSNYVRMVRSVAVSRNTRSRLVVGADGTRLTMQALESGTWTNVGTGLTLESGVRIENVNPNTGLEFNAQGTTTAATTLTLATSSGSTRAISVSFLGNVS